MVSSISSSAFWNSMSPRPWGSAMESKPACMRSQDAADVHCAHHAMRIRRQPVGGSDPWRSIDPSDHDRPSPVATACFRRFPPVRRHQLALASAARTNGPSRIQTVRMPTCHAKNRTPLGLLPQSILRMSLLLCDISDEGPAPRFGGPLGWRRGDGA